MLIALCQACEPGAGEAELPGVSTVLCLPSGLISTCSSNTVAETLLLPKRVPRGHRNIRSSAVYPCVAGFVLGISWVLRLAHWYVCW